MEKEKTEEISEINATEEHEHIKREVVVPGEVVGTGTDILPGEGTRREGKDIVSLKFGLLEKTGNLVKVIPLGGVYIPRRGNVVVGQVVDITFNGWLIDIGASNNAFLSVTECFGRIRDPAEYFTFGDILVVEIKSVKSRGIDASMMERGLERLEGGMLMQINSTRVPRIIGRKGSMISEIKKETGCSVVVGQNGVIWISGKNVDEEMLAKDAIEFVAQKPFVSGLTEKVQSFLKEKRQSK